MNNSCEMLVIFFGMLLTIDGCVVNIEQKRSVTTQLLIERLVLEACVSLAYKQTKKGKALAHSLSMRCWHLVMISLMCTYGFDRTNWLKAINSFLERNWPKEKNVPADSSFGGCFLLDFVPKSRGTIRYLTQACIVQWARLGAMLSFVVWLEYTIRARWRDVTNFGSRVQD